MLNKKEVMELINVLPDKIRVYAISLKAAEINSQLFTLSGVPFEKQTDLSFLIASVIVKKISITEFIRNLENLLGWPSEKLQSLILEIVGCRFLIIDDWLDSEPSKYLLSKSINLSRYAAVVAEHRFAISKEEEFFIAQIAKEPDYVNTKINDVNDVLKTDISYGNNEQKNKNITSNSILSAPDINIDKEKKSLLSFLKSNILRFFITNDQKAVDDYNYIFMLVWLQNGSFKSEALTAILSNQEIISKNKILIDEKMKICTVSSLLKSYIKLYGVEADDLHIAEFLSSKTIKSFTENEKVLVMRILKFYRNINNLEYNLNQLEGGKISNFEILPSLILANKDNNIFEKFNLRNDNKKYINSQDSSKQDQIENNNLIINTNSLEAEFKLMLQDYSPDSLEYKAIEQELKRLQNKA